MFENESPNEIWRSLTTDYIGFYTTRNQSSIPEEPGVYGWFVPFIYDAKDPSTYIEALRKLFSYDSSDEKLAEKKITYNFKWDPIDVTVKRNVSVESEVLMFQEHLADMALKDKSQLFELQKTLMVCSLFSRPLYVGMTSDLRRRHNEHKVGSLFRKRFDEFVIKENIPISFGDLIFCAIRMPYDNEKSNAGLIRRHSEVLEKIIQLLCQPLFSKK